ncbi:unnamed protein product, partial [marine sediment metagenome]
MDPKVVLIIINYNGKPHLTQCLDSIFSQAYENFEVVLVDNKSTDDSIDFVKSNYPKVEVFKNKKNLGFGKAINNVLKVKLKDKENKWFGVLNNDIKLDSDWLKNLINYTQKTPKAGILSGKILLYYWPKY